MEFGEKLDFMMNLTKTTNSMLAKHMSMDASYISRLRTGSRRLSKNTAYVGAMASYFAKRCVEKSALEAIVTASGRKGGGDTAEKPEELIALWLGEMSADTLKPVGDFLDRLSNISFKKPQLAEPVRAADTSGGEARASIYYGITGKREAVIAFLSETLRQEIPRTLLLFSEENFDWLTENREFAALWSSLLVQVVMKGNRIKIIHSISRHLGEMLAGISEWLPIYMTGMVEPYYYPKTRDGIFQRTIFVAPGVAAVLSTSVDGRSSKTANYLIYDKKAVAAAASEFNDYLEFCRPLLHIFRDGNTKELLQKLDEFTCRQADTIVSTGAQSILTMPEESALELAKALPEAEREAIYDNYRRRLQLFEKYIKVHRVHEIIRLPDIEEVRTGKLRIIVPEFLAKRDIFYSPRTYKLHMENMTLLLKEYDNYNVYIDEGGLPDDNIIYVKEDIGVLVAKTTAPSALFAISESKMTAAFWDYLKGFIGKDFGSVLNKKRTLEKLEAVVKYL